MNNLNTKAWLGLVFLAIAMGLLLFLAAGTVQYWQAWAYLAVYFVASFLITLYLMKKDPALLKRRLSGGPGRSPADYSIAQILWSPLPQAIFNLSRNVWIAPYRKNFSV